MLAPTTLVYLATQPWQLGDLATWLGAAANIATVILALAAAIVGYRVYRVESGRDARAEHDRRERAADDRRAQATLVSAWYGRSADSTEMYPGSGWSTYSWGGWVLNASDSPIYDVVVTFYLRDSQPHRIWRSGLIRVIPPYRGELYVGADDAHEQLTEDEWKNQLDVSLEFRDGASRHWMRDRQGYLQELPSMPPIDQR